MRKGWRNWHPKGNKRNTIKGQRQGAKKDMTRFLGGTARTQRSRGKKKTWDQENLSRSRRKVKHTCGA